jgi:hypothetical protein
MKKTMADTKALSDANCPGTSISATMYYCDSAFTPSHGPQQPDGIGKSVSKLFTPLKRYPPRATKLHRGGQGQRIAPWPENTKDGKIDTLTYHNRVTRLVVQCAQ